MKCPINCNVELQPTIRHKLKVNYCPSCEGMWLEHDELQELEDEVFGMLRSPTAVQVPI